MIGPQKRIDTLNRISHFSSVGGETQWQMNIKNTDEGPGGNEEESDYFRRIRTRGERWGEKKRKKTAHEFSKRCVARKDLHNF